MRDRKCLREQVWEPLCAQWRKKEEINTLVFNFISSFVQLIRWLITTYMRKDLPFCHIGRAQWDQWSLRSSLITCIALSRDVLIFWENRATGDATSPQFIIASIRCASPTRTFHADVDPNDRPFLLISAALSEHTSRKIDENSLHRCLPVKRKTLQASREIEKSAGAPVMWDTNDNPVPFALINLSLRIYEVSLQESSFA